jgi:hypothetical protein
VPEFAFARRDSTLVLLAQAGASPTATPSKSECLPFVPVQGTRLAAVNSRGLKSLSVHRPLHTGRQPVDRRSKEGDGDRGPRLFRALDERGTLQVCAG